MKSRWQIGFAALIVLSFAAMPVSAVVLHYDVEFLEDAGTPGLFGWFSVDHAVPANPVFENVTARPIADFRIESAAGEVFDPVDVSTLTRIFYVDGLFAGLDVLMEDFAAPKGQGARLDIATGFRCPAQVCETIGQTWDLANAVENGHGRLRFVVQAVAEPVSSTLVLIAVLCAGVAHRVAGHRSFSISRRVRSHSPRFSRALYSSG